MSKRQHIPQPCCYTPPNKRRPPPQQQQQRQHVYLVVDDWERGYSVRKVDVYAFDSGAGAGAGSGAGLDKEAEPLPDPPVARFDSPHCRISDFVAHGTSILAMPCSTTADSAFPVFDTTTLALSLCTHPNGQKTWSRPVSATVAGKLHMMVGSIVCALGAPPRRCGVIDESTPRSWTVGSAPLESARVVSNAAHPDGRTLFVSGAESSFCLDTESESLGWTCQGKWVMPFKGQAYYDGELDAWVGLCRYKGGVGYVCSCDVPQPVAAATGMPAWKLGKDKLFSPDNENERHLGAILLHLGNSDYCLIESLVHKDDYLSYVNGDADWPFERCRVPRRRVFYMTRFGLKYDKNGELRTTRTRARSYEMTEGHVFNDIHSNPVAFWM